MKFRRRRQGLTDYRKRLELVKSGLQRVVVRRSNKRIMGQVVAYEERGDKVMASVDSRELEKLGWPSRNNKPTAYLSGLLLAKKAKAEGELVLDIGIAAPVRGSVPFVFAKGCIDGGMKLKGTFDMKEEQYDGTLIARYAERLGKDSEVLKRQFGAYIAKGGAPSSLPALFGQVREKILKGS
jgi:large subunit ribosomal protein L18